jgi:hypothetical protein
MTEVSKRILDQYQVRKSRKQKHAFIEFLQKYFPEMKIEYHKGSGSNNLILGNPAKSKILISAHYDTCAQLPIPNFVTPLKPVLSILYGLILIIPICAVILALHMLLIPIIDSYSLRNWLSIALLYYIIIFGPANKHTVNDNTSGVITLCELYQSLTAEEKENVCLIFFDNEEKGLLGSAAYRKQHKEEIKNQLLINLDCVSDGSNILLAVSKKARESYMPSITEAFSETTTKKVLLKNLEKVYYPSDQAKFPLSIAIAALKFKKIPGYYMDRIHTKRDTIMDEGNIQFITENILKLIRSIN